MNRTDEVKRKYFAELAPKYALITGNATYDQIAEILNTHDLRIENDSIIHDNACGPGTATEALVPFLSSRDLAPRIIATDYSDGMINMLNQTIKQAGSNPSVWQNVETQICDSSNLTTFKDDFFTHSVNNFSLFTFSQPVPSLKETYRTLRPGGLAIVTVWKRFPVTDLLIAGQMHVKGTKWAEEHAIPVNGPEYFQEGYVATQLAEAGFDPANIRDEPVVKTLVKPGNEWWDGLYQFFTTSSMALASIKDFEEEEKARWPDAVQHVMQQEKEKYGGVLFEGFLTMATK